MSWTEADSSLWLAAHTTENGHKLWGFHSEEEEDNDERICRGLALLFDISDATSVLLLDYIRADPRFSTALPTQEHTTPLTWQISEGVSAWPFTSRPRSISG